MRISEAAVRFGFSLGGGGWGDTGIEAGCSGQGDWSFVDVG